MWPSLTPCSTREAEEAEGHNINVVTQHDDDDDDKASRHRKTQEEEMKTHGKPTTKATARRRSDCGEGAPGKCLKKHEELS
jgi:hypothetical protein